MAEAMTGGVDFLWGTLPPTRLWRATSLKEGGKFYTSTSRPVLEERKMESISLTIIAPSLMWM